MQVVEGFKYVPTEIGVKFHESDAKVKLVVGPFGSGKSCMVMNDALFYCLAQNPAPDGVRYTRIAIIRGSYPELQSTTRKSVMEVFPAQFGTMRESGSPISGHYFFPVGDGPYDYRDQGRPWQDGDGTYCNVEIEMYAIPDIFATEKFKSLNASFAIINEGTSVAKEVVAALMGRVGRYPPESMGGCSYSGILIDTNQPAQGHFLLDYIEHPLPGWDVFKQPPAAFKHVDDNNQVTYELNRNAENLCNLGSAQKPTGFNEWDDTRKHEWYINRGLSYYQSQIDVHLKNGRPDLVDSLFCMEDVPIQDGKPVFTMFNANLHVANTQIDPIPYKTVIVGYDTSGIHPATVFLQEQHGKWIVLDDLYGEDMGMEAFLDKALMPLISSKYYNCNIIVSCDPANAKDSYTGLAPSQHLQDRGLTVYMPKTNDPKTRINGVENLLNKNVGGLLISSNCKFLIKAMQGGYHYKRMRLTGSIEDAYDSRPEKNKYSHIGDALQYACLCIQRDDYVNYDARPMVRETTRRRKVLRRIM